MTLQISTTSFTLDVCHCGEAGIYTEETTFAFEAHAAYASLQKLLVELDAEFKRLKTDLADKCGSATEEVFKVKATFEACWARSVTLVQNVSIAHKLLIEHIIPLCCDPCQHREKKIIAITTFTEHITKFSHEVEAIKKTLSEVVVSFTSIDGAFYEWCTTTETTCRTQIERVTTEVETLKIRLVEVKAELTKIQTNGHANGLNKPPTLTNTNGWHPAAGGITSPTQSTISSFSVSSEATVVQSLSEIHGHAAPFDKSNHDDGVVVHVQGGLPDSTSSYGSKRGTKSSASSVSIQSIAATPLRSDGKDIMIQTGAREAAAVTLNMSTTGGGAHGHSAHLQSAVAETLSHDSKNYAIHADCEDAALVTVVTRVGGQDVPITLIIRVPKLPGTKAKPEPRSTDGNVPGTCGQPYLPGNRPKDPAVTELEVTIKEIDIEITKKKTTIERLTTEIKTITETRGRVQVLIKKDLFARWITSVQQIWEECHGDLLQARKYVDECTTAVTKSKTRYLRTSVHACASTWWVMYAYLAIFSGAAKSITHAKEITTKEISSVTETQTRFKEITHG